MLLDRRRFLAVAAVVGAAACSKTSDGAGGYGAGSPTDRGGSAAGSASDVPPATGAPPGNGAPNATGGTTASVSGTTRPAISDPTTTPSADASPPTPPSAPGPGADPATFVVRGPGTISEVALTFHTNGDLGLAQRLLDIAADHGATFTSFVVGNWLEANPAWARKLLDGGHELANHTYTHPTFSSLSPTAMAAEIERCKDVLVRLTGSGGRFVRPSGTDDGLAPPPPAVLAAAGRAGYPTVLGWDVEPFDYKDPGAEAVRARVLDGVRPGAVVSLHFGHRGTVDALDGILGGMRSRGLAAVTVSRLLGG